MQSGNIWKHIAPEVRTDNLPICLSDDEIHNTRVFWYSIIGNASIHLPACEGFARVLFLSEGNATFILGEKQIIFSDKAVVVPGPHSKIEIQAISGAKILEIDWNLNSSEYAEYSSLDNDVFFAMRYVDAKKYNESCKSAKTTSRMLVPPRVIPRFSMGSVETSENDRIEKHAHPMLEQYFFGLNNNNCELLVDDTSIQFGAHTLVHIPLGSEHGVQSGMNQFVHYLWIDFLFDETGLEYLDKAHQMIDT